MSALYLVYFLCFLVYFPCFDVFTSLFANDDNGFSILTLLLLTDSNLIYSSFMSVLLFFVGAFVLIVSLILFFLQLHACVGSSLGGMLSLMAAAEFPDRVGRSVDM